MPTTYAPKENSYLDYKGWEHSAFTQGTKAFLKIKETSRKCLNHQTMLMPEFSSTCRIKSIEFIQCLEILPRKITFRE